MPRLLQVNIVSNTLSTGKIVEDISKVARERGWDTYVAYGRTSIPGVNKEYHIGSTVESFWHYLENRLFDNEGLASRFSTYRLIRYINRIKPDVIHLHNIHDHYFNYHIFFNYVNKSGIKIIWTFHDFWAITGHCHYYIGADCDLWKTQCHNCPLQHSTVNSLIDRSTRNYDLKKRLFSANSNLVVVPVSPWVESIVRESFLKDKKIVTIPNSLDIGSLVSEPEMVISCIPKGAFVILGVATDWVLGGRKGFDDFLKLSNLLQEDEKIVLVGMKNEQMKSLPSNVIGIVRTTSKTELANIYRRANVLLSLSSAETFGLTIIEANAFGVPAVVYNNTAPPSLISVENGYVAKDRDVRDVYDKIQMIKSKGINSYRKSCQDYAMRHFDKNKNYQRYVDLYEEQIIKNEEKDSNYKCRIPT